jgi:hypothetical protein
VAGPVWKVAPVTSGQRPVYEAVLDASGKVLVRGREQGWVPVGAPCGAQRFAISRNSYRDVAETDVTLDSPTYKGRTHTAICTLQ